MDNERRADLGHEAVLVVARVETSAENAETSPENAETSVVDTLACVAHFCDRLGVDPKAMFADGLESYRGDEEDGPFAEHTLNALEPLGR
jgi:hypothetical protein